MPIVSDDDGIHLLTGDGFGYALAVSHDPAPLQTSVRHLHWGAPISMADARVLARRAPTRARPSGTWSQPRAHEEEYVVQGGYRHDEAALVVEFPDGVRSADLRCDAIVAEDECLSIHLVDRAYPVGVMLRYHIQAEHSALVREVEVRNDTDGPLRLQQAASATWCPPQRTGYRLTTLSGGYAAETGTTHRPVGIGRILLESRTGISGHEHQPWLALDTGADDEHGEVWSIALAWSGSWRAVVQALLDGGTHVTIGVGGDLAYVLGPGETLRLPPSIGVYTGAGHIATTQLWHSYERARVLPDRDRLRPILFNSWEATHFEVTAEGQLELARRARDLGVELFVVDDGWFRPNADDTGGLGDWHVVESRFPKGVAELSSEVRRLGLQFGLWVEPEMVSADSDLYSAHPDWIYRWPNREPTLIRHQYMLDFARVEVRHWAVRTLDRLVTEAGLDYLKWDMNRSLAEPWSAAGGNPWFDHVWGLYEVIDELRVLHPQLLIESCAAGGGRADLGILSRAHWAWPSDNTDALDRLSIQDGYTHAHSAMSMACWVTDSPGSLTGRSLPLAFRFHVAMCGVLGIGGNLLSWGAQQVAEARALVAQYREIRPLVQFGVQYRLGSVADETFGVAYIALDGSEAAVLAFAPAVRHGAVGQDLRLRGLDPCGTYRDLDTGAINGGNLLMHCGLRLHLHGDHMSTLA